MKLRDPEFFEKIARPFLLNKREKTFMDFFLLEKDGPLLNFLEQPHLRESLNALELALLAVFLARRGDTARA